MTNLHDARVEAAARASYATQRRSLGLPDNWDALAPEYQEARLKSQTVALAAADAVVTVEMIADTAHKAMQDSWTDSEEYEHAPAYIARAVLALIRGGGEQC